MLMKHNELDEIDIEILNILQRDGRAAVKEIAKRYACHRLPYQTG